MTTAFYVAIYRKNVCVEEEIYQGKVNTNREHWVIRHFVHFADIGYSQHMIGIFYLKRGIYYLDRLMEDYTAKEIWYHLVYGNVCARKYIGQDLFDKKEQIKKNTEVMEGWLEKS